VITRARLFAKPVTSKATLAAFTKKAAAFLPSANQSQRGGGAPLLKWRCFGARACSPEQVLHGSNWRRHHQALAMFFHYKARNALAYLQL
jgi:hypothetical protein